MINLSLQYGTLGQYPLMIELTENFQKHSSLFYQSMSGGEKKSFVVLTHGHLL
jgi:hypothetical protein